MLYPARIRFRPSRIRADFSRFNPVAGGLGLLGSVALEASVWAHSLPIIPSCAGTHPPLAIAYVDYASMNIVTVVCKPQYLVAVLSPYYRAKWNITVTWCDLKAKINDHRVVNLPDVRINLRRTSEVG